MDLRIRNSVRSSSGRRRRSLASLGALVSLVTAGLVVVAFSASAATTNGDPVTWAQTECIAQVGSGTLGTPIDITVHAVVPNQVNVSQSLQQHDPGRHRDVAGRVERVQHRQLQQPQPDLPLPE